jgi:hypothetical protein
MPKAIDVLPVLAATTLGPALIVNALATDKALPTWSRVLGGVTGVVAVAFGLSAMFSQSREAGSLAQQLSDGAQMELEHGVSLNEAMKIALDHLSKDPQYYNKLAAAGIR